MDVKHVLYRFAFTIYSRIGQEFPENAVYSPYSAFISTAVSAAISQDDVIYSKFLEFIGFTENLSEQEIISELQNIIQESETITVSSPYFLDMLKLISKNENSKDLAYNYMRNNEQYLMYSHIKKQIIEIFPEIIFDSEDTLFLHFCDYYNSHKQDERIQRFLRSIEVPISRLRKAPTVLCSNIICINKNSEKKDLTDKLTKICSKLNIVLQTNTFPQPATDQINQEIDKRTNGLVSRVLTEHSITKDIKIMNVNTLVFEAKWVKYFPVVELQDFHLYSGEKRKIKTMFMRNKKCLYFENENIQVLQLNYACSQYSMIYILNKNSQSVQISNNELEKAIDSLKETDVYIEIPRFEAEFGPSSIDSCFPPDLCKDANKNYMNIIQKIRIGNYEEGTLPTPPNEEDIEKKKEVSQQNESNEVIMAKEETESLSNINQKEAESIINKNQTEEEDKADKMQNKDQIQVNDEKEEPQEIPEENSKVENEKDIQSTFLTENQILNNQNNLDSTNFQNVNASNSANDSISNSLSQSELHPKTTESNYIPESKSNRINTATSPTASSTDINLGSAPLSPVTRHEEEEEVLNNTNCERAGASAEFLCNHPFLFFVINRSNHVILLMGTITDPIAADLQPLTVEQRADNFLASIRGDELPFPPTKEDDLFSNEKKNSDSIWDEIEQIGDSPSNKIASHPLTPKQDEELTNEKNDESNTNQTVNLEAQIDDDLLEYVYGGKPKPPPNKKKINQMFGYESQKKKTFSSFSPWSNVVFYKAKSSLSPYKALDKSKYHASPQLPPLPPLSDLSTTNWDNLEKELEESGTQVMHSSAIKKTTPKLVEPKTNAVLSLRMAKKKRF